MGECTTCAYGPTYGSKDKPRCQACFDISPLGRAYWRNYRAKDSEPEKTESVKTNILNNPKVRSQMKLYEVTCSLHGFVYTQRVCAESETAAIEYLFDRGWDRHDNWKATLIDSKDIKAELKEELIYQKAVLEAVEQLDWYSINEQGVLHEGAPNEESAFVRYTEVEAALAAINAAEGTTVGHACWLPRNPSDPDSMHYCSHCKTEISAVKALYHKYCFECGYKMDLRAWEA